MAMAIAPGRILFEDEHLLVVQKLARELAVAADGEGKLSLHDFLRKQYPGLRVLHRLDFGTSGAIAFAKTAEVAEYVRRSKFSGWKKTYLALAAGRIERRSGTIDTPLKARTIDEAVPAVSHYRVVEAFPYATLVEVDIDTGRKHQIRQHLAAIGHPLLCDPLYGNAKADRAFSKQTGFRHFFLHALRLSFPHPMLGVRVEVTAPPPKAFEHVVERLKRG